MGHERAEPSGSSRASWLVWLERPLVARELHHWLKGRRPDLPTAFALDLACSVSDYGSLSASLASVAASLDASPRPWVRPKGSFSFRRFY